MRKLTVSIHCTANNIVTGPPSGDLTDFMQWADGGIGDTLDALLRSLSSVDCMLLGRGTYEDLVRKWPLVKEWPDVSEIALRIGEKVNTARKLVVAGQSTPDQLAWGEYEPATKIIGSDAITRIKDLKAEPGGDIITFGSPILVRSLTDARLVDEYQLIVHPVIVAEGLRLFDDLAGRTDLRLDGVESFTGGAMIVTYSPVPA